MRKRREHRFFLLLLLLNNCYLFLAVLGHCCCIQAFSSCGQWGYSRVGRASCCSGFSYCGAGAREHTFSCYEASGIVPDQGSNKRLLQYQADS